MLDNYFNYKKHKTDFKTEVIAGTTTFLTMAYIMFLNPFILFSFLMFLLITGCQTIKDKTDAIIEKENEKLSKYISKPASVLQMELGKPDEDFKNDKGNFELIYNTKKYGIPCERRFEINTDNIVIGFVSNGCF